MREICVYAENICVRSFTEPENNYAIAPTFAARTKDSLTDLLDFFISEIVIVDKFVALGTGGFPRSGNGETQLGVEENDESVRMMSTYEM
jgi:hypothetical protein